MNHQSKMINTSREVRIPNNANAYQELNSIESPPCAKVRFPREHHAPDVYTNPKTVQAETQEGEQKGCESKRTMTNPMSLVSTSRYYTSSEANFGI